MGCAPSWGFRVFGFGFADAGVWFHIPALAWDCTEFQVLGVRGCTELSAPISGGIVSMLFRWRCSSVSFIILPMSAERLAMRLSFSVSRCSSCSSSTWKGRDSVSDTAFRDETACQTPRSGTRQGVRHRVQGRDSVSDTAFRDETGCQTPRVRLGASAPVTDSENRTHSTSAANTDTTRASPRRRCELLGPLGYNSSQHSPTTRPSVERSAYEAFLLSGRV